LSGGGSYAQIIRRTVSVTMFGLTCRCLDLETLIESKRAAGRTKELDAIAELEALTDELKR